MHRRARKKQWVVSEDDVGRAILQWTVDPNEIPAQDGDDPLAQTYNLLKRLELPDLCLEGEFDDDQHNPYNSGVYPAGTLRPGR